MYLIIKRVLENELWLVFFRTVTARGIAASGSLLLGIILGRVHGAEGVGVFALAQGFLFGAAILARFGMDNALMRYVGRNRHDAQIFAYLAWSAKRAISLALLAALALWFSSDLLSGIFNKPSLSAVLAGISVAIPAFTLIYILSGFMKGMHRPATACFLESGYISLLTGILILLITWVTGRAELGDTGLALAIATWIVLLQGGIQLLRLKRHARYKGEQEQEVDKSTLDGDGFRESARAFFVMSIAEFMQSVLSVIIAGMLLSGHDLGLFKSAERVALLIGFILMIVSTIFPPRFAALYHQNDKDAMIRLARQSTLFGAALASPLLIACLVVPEWLLALFGDDFIAATPYLRILAIAQTINVATASVAFLLNMTGHETLMRNIALFSAAIGLLAFLVSIPWFGALGAALSLALVLILQNLLALVFVRKSLGFWIYPALR